MFAKNLIILAWLIWCSTSSSSIANKGNASHIDREVALCQYSKRATTSSSSSEPPIQVSELKYWDKANEYIRKGKDDKIKNNLHKHNTLRLHDFDAMHEIAQRQLLRIRRANYKIDRLEEKIAKDLSNANAFSQLAEKLDNSLNQRNTMDWDSHVAFISRRKGSMTPDEESWARSGEEARLLVCQDPNLPLDDGFFDASCAHAQMRIIRSKLKDRHTRDAERKELLESLNKNKDEFDAIVNKDIEAARRVSEYYSDSLHTHRERVQKLRLEITQRQERAQLWETLANEASAAYSYPGYYDRQGAMLSPSFSELSIDRDGARSSVLDSGDESDNSCRIPYGSAQDGENFDYYEG